MCFGWRTVSWAGDCAGYALNPHEIERFPPVEMRAKVKPRTKKRDMEETKPFLRSHIRDGYRN